MPDDRVQGQHIYARAISGFALGVVRYRGVGGKEDEERRRVGKGKEQGEGKASEKGERRRGRKKHGGMGTGEARGGKMKKPKYHTAY